MELQTPQAADITWKRAGSSPVGLQVTRTKIEQNKICSLIRALDFENIYTRRRVNDIHYKYHCKKKAADFICDLRALSSTRLQRDRLCMPSEPNRQTRRVLSGDAKSKIGSPRHSRHSRDPRDRRTMTSRRCDYSHPKVSTSDATLGFDRIFGIVAERCFAHSSCKDTREWTANASELLRDRDWTATRNTDPSNRIQIPGRRRDDSQRGSPLCIRNSVSLGSARASSARPPLMVDNSESAY
ncbi:hypothetical protein ALC56_02986 [Trachymyrmex septentrionalis]|uniref:Uncharacterized protein n=1 Tax=Trachymyrmex septentrionalis TaxID=34720 RepID=A0A195FQF8_9HYME|nr:hypothetical protein ALC56_02986 [Trachymyrmex septentrionalis]